jgi:uncharacterized protein
MVNTKKHAYISDLGHQLIVSIQKYKRVVVAFSGGVDSAVVAKAAYLALQENAWAVMSVSPSLAGGELETARHTASSIGINFRTIQTLEYLNPGYQKNASNRCYFCKSELYSTIGSLREELNYEVILNGANADDAGDHRPGMRAAEEYQVVSPLLELGINKRDVRLLAQDWNLPIWDKPATPCLASRIAYGVEVTIPGLKRIDQAEQFLKRVLELNELRVRDLGQDVARIELPSPALTQSKLKQCQAEISEHFQQLGFKTVLLNTEPFLSGILNQSSQPPVFELYHIEG